MGSVRIGPIILIISMMALGLFVVMSIMVGTGNVLGATYRYVLPASFVIGCVAPRASMYVLVLMAGYLDILKKALVAGGAMNFEDLYFVLGMPSVMVVGIVLHYLATFALRIRPMTGRDGMLLLIAGVFVVVTAMVAVVQAGLTLGVLKSLANSSAYYSLVFVFPLVFRGPEEIQRFFRFVLIAMIPAALHGLWHFLGVRFGEPFGLFEFEKDYMDTGFSINLKYVLSGEGVFGPFSAQGPLATTMSLCAALCLLPLLARGERKKGERLLPAWALLGLFALYTAAAVFSLKRGPLLVIPGIMVGMIVLRSWILTGGAYALALAGLVTLVAMGEEFAYKLADWQTTVFNVTGRGETATDLFRVRTFHTRFIDFSLLKDPANWQPFGSPLMEGEDQYYAHSLIVKVFLQYGYVPVGIALAILLPVLFLVHRRLIRMSRGRSTEVGQLRFAAAAAFSLLGSAGLGILSMTAYPNPYFFGVFLAIMAGVMTKSLQPARAPAPASEEEIPVVGSVVRLPAGQ